MKKKAKHQLKHQAFLDRLQSSQSPYSKSHNRRLKRKEKEQLVTQMGDLSAVLDEMDPTTAADLPGITSARRKDGTATGIVPRMKPGQIGEGKGATLSKAQRKQALYVPVSKMTFVPS